MKPKLLFSILCAFTLCASICGFVLNRRSQLSTAATSVCRVFQVRGEVRALDIPNKTVRVAREEIPGYMPAMTMPLPVKDVSLLMHLNAGDPVQFELSVTENDSWISGISKIALDGAGKPVVSNINGVNVSDLNEELQKGEVVPDFELTDQNGRNLRLSSLHGKIVLLTFVYTRCPLPNFCPLMSHNFQSLQQRLEKAYPGKFHLITA
jgi:protein SCO1/2